MIQKWKILPMLKGALTSLPVLNEWRLNRARTEGSDSPRYCYSVWLRHLVTLHGLGFKANGANIGELGPGDSIGVGLAALLSGAKSYTGLDLVPFSAKADLHTILGRLVEMYSQRAAIPDQNEFPRVRPRLDSYEFPSNAVSGVAFDDKVEEIRTELRKGMNSGSLLHYHAPWPTNHNVPVASLDLVFSQAVLEHVDDLEGTYRSMFSWLRSGGYASHSIDFSAHYLSPFWNGHWSYSDWQWRIVRGGREFLLNREPLSKHLNCALKAGFEILVSRPQYDDRGLQAVALQQRFRFLDPEDSRTRGVTLVLRKPSQRF